MAPIVDGLEAEYGSQVAFQRLNVDAKDGKAAANTYRARGHPAIIILDAGGDVVWSRIGVQPRDVVVSALEQALTDESR